jgi:hypothetical protein
MADDNDKTRKPHEKRIPHRVNYNNIDLSHHAKHDWKPAHEARHKEKMAARAARETESGPINIRVYFQELDRTGLCEYESGGGEKNATYEWLPANHSAFDDDPLVPTPIPTPGPGADYIDVLDFPGGDSAMNLLRQIMDDYVGTQDAFVCDPEPDDTPPDERPPTPLYYVPNLTIAGTPYNTPGETEEEPDPGYDPAPEPEPAPPYDDGEHVHWLGWSWMFYDGHDEGAAPYWDPEDNDPWYPDEPGYNGPDGEDGYPNGTLDEYHPLEDLLADTINEDDYYQITFSYERQCFWFYYEEQEDENGAKHMELVIRPMRLRKKPKDTPEE